MKLPRKPLFFALLPILLLFTSCDPISTWEFHLVNNSTQPVRVDFEAVYYDWPDSTYTVAPGEEVLILEVSEISNEAMDIYPDSMGVFHRIAAFQNDTLPTNTTLMSRQVWGYSQLEKRRAEYRVNLIDESFQ